MKKGFLCTLAHIYKGLNCSKLCLQQGLPAASSDFKMNYYKNS